MAVAALGSAQQQRGSGEWGVARSTEEWGVRSGRELLAWKKGWEFVGEWAFIDRHRSRWGRLRWLSLLPWVGRDLREVLKVTELRLSEPSPRGARFSEDQKPVQ